MRMKVPRALQIIGLLAGGNGVLAGLFLLEREPLLGVLGILGSMALLLGTLANLADEEARSDFEQDTHLGEY
jgi:hypothetical protein